jgi:hypothetical protein
MMAALILVRDDVDWQASNGLFEFVLEYLIPRLSDRATAEWLRTVVDDNLGSIWVPEFPEATQTEVFDLLRSGLIFAAEQELPAGPSKEPAVEQLRELVGLLG